MANKLISLRTSLIFDVKVKNWQQYYNLSMKQPPNLHNSLRKQDSNFPINPNSSYLQKNKEPILMNIKINYTLIINQNKIKIPGLIFDTKLSLIY